MPTDTDVFHDMVIKTYNLHGIIFTFNESGVVGAFNLRLLLVVSIATTARCCPYWAGGLIHCSGI